ncbi:cell surface A33 antigen-like [Hippoglossus stenolepis]|uniref:cell surface A33 antigen-like n=1 Tax=Hippoglossus stenolepis TaxID=195615 RepID=UPI001FAFAE6C|nr:cell surface A33 antigen-like [Hippoglossus stenolepis]
MSGWFYPVTAMTTKKQVGWRKLFLILTVLPCCRSLEVSIPKAEYMVARGSDVALTCSFSPARPDFNTIVLSWDVDPDNIDAPMESVATYFMNNPIDIAPAFEGRATLEVDLKNRVSTLTLKKVTMRDSRRFQCSVLIPNDDEGTTAASTSLLVLVPPSPPVCSINGKADYWNDISLTCSSEEGSPQPVYEWKSFSVENVERGFPPKTTEKDGVLSLFNISRGMSGFYTCTSTNRVGSASCNFTLSVTPGGMNEGSIAGVVVGVLAGLLVLGIVVFCCYRKKGKKDKYAEGAPAGVEFYDRDAPEAGEHYLDDETSGETKQHKQHEDKEAAPKNIYTAAVGHKFDDDQNSHSSGKEKDGGKGSDIDSKRYRDDKHDHYRGSREHLDDKPNHPRGSRDRLDEQPDHSRGSRDRLDDQRDRSRGSRDRLDEPRDRYGGSRDRLDEQPDHSRGSRDRLDDQRDRSRGSRDRLDEPRDRYGGSRDRLDDQRDNYRGSQDRLDEPRGRNGGSRD